ncbi:hypothetical protein DPMN_067417 [Dreissena polymorpha]|uniref:Uncharacterized protein n=1 Tax=Dreissena polymorpha TaxID=45954 RepID=A0A9D3YXX1_DREPO|nr:hypothetical protein DPMN_067417 [Dreissena polymorpha]
MEHNVENNRKIDNKAAAATSIPNLHPLRLGISGRCPMGVAKDGVGNFSFTFLMCPHVTDYSHIHFTLYLPPMWIPILPVSLVVLMYFLFQYLSRPKCIIGPCSVEKGFNA